MDELKAVSITRETDICTKILLENPKKNVTWLHGNMILQLIGKG